MRRPIALCLSGTVVLLAACGGDSPTKPDPDGDPPVATTIAPQAGDNQTTTSGTAVGVAPSVIVRDQDGQPMRGVNVAFVVDSGGGSVTNATASTNSNGVASSGGWTVGMGRNKLRATVSGLQPVFFIATGQGGIELTHTTLPASGGTITIDRPGHPLNGMQFTMPPNAYAAPVEIEISAGDSAGVPHQSGLRLASPVINISSNAAGQAADAIELQIPSNVTTAEWPVVIMYDRRTGAMDVLTSAPLAGGKVVAFTRHLDPAALLPRKGTQAGTLFAVVGGKQIDIAIYGLPKEEYDRDLDTGYQPALDDWEFDFFRTTGRINSGFGTGLPMAAAWYHAVYSGSLGRLGDRYQDAPPLGVSNRRGIRLGAVLYSLTNYVGENSLLQRMIVKMSVLTGISQDSLTMVNLKAIIRHTGYPAILTGVDPNNDDQPIAGMLVYKTVGNTLHVSLGSNTFGTSGLSTTLMNGRFTPMTMTYSDGLDGTSVGPMVLKDYYLNAPTAGIPTSFLTTAFAQFFNGTIGSAPIATNDPIFVNVSLQSLEKRDIADTIFVADDTTRIWWECGVCATGHVPTPAINPVGKVVGANIHEKTQLGWLLSTKSMAGNGFKIHAGLDGVRLGFAVTMPQDGTGKPLYHDWKEAAIKFRKLVLTPNPLDIVSNTAYEVTATFADPLPPNPSWTWELGDGRTVTTQTNKVTVRYPSDVANPQRSPEIKATLRSGTVKHASGKVTANVTTPLYTAWRITSATFTVIDDSRGSDPLFQAAFDQWRNSSGANSNQQQMFNTYRTDSLFFLQVQSGAPAAIALLEGDVPRPDVSPTFGHVKGVYWWTYGSVPASALTQITAGLVGSSNNITLGRGIFGNLTATSCVSRYSGFHAQAGTPDNGTVNGQMWVVASPLNLASGPEPSVTSKYEVTMNGDVATGSMSKTFRLGAMCFGVTEITWTLRVQFTAQRIK